MITLCIAGESGSGKTTCADLCVKQLTEMGYRAVGISLDSFYHPRDTLSDAEAALVNYDEPAAFDEEFLKEVIAQFAAKNAVNLPSYDYITRRRSVSAEATAAPDILIIEGIVPLQLSVVFNITIYLDAPDAMARRVFRDYLRHDSGFTFRCYQQVQSMAQTYISPQKELADYSLQLIPTNQSAISGIQAAFKEYETLKETGDQRHADRAQNNELSQQLTEYYLPIDQLMSQHQSPVGQDIIKFICSLVSKKTQQKTQASPSACRACLAFNTSRGGVNPSPFPLGNPVANSL